MSGTATVQGRLWSTRPQEWAELQEGAVRPLYDAVLDRLALRPGMKVLDAGCGAGGFCVLAAERGAEVTGIDAAPGLVEIAKARNPGGDFRVGELEELPYADASFDTVTGFNSFQFAGDPVNALRQAARVVRSGGPVVVATWGPPEQCEAAAGFGALGALMPPPPPGAEGPFALSAPGALERLADTAGLRPEEVVDVPTPWQYPNIDTAVTALLSSGPASIAIAAAGEHAARAALAEAFESFTQDDGSILLHNVFRYLVAVSSWPAEPRGAARAARDD